MLGNVFAKCMQPRIALFTKNPFNILSSEALDLAGICRTLFSTVHFNGLNQSPRRWAKRHQRWWTFAARVRVRVSLVGVSLVRVGLVRVSLVRVSLVRVGCIREKTISLQTCRGKRDECIILVPMVYSCHKLSGVFFPAQNSQPSNCSHMLHA